MWPLCGRSHRSMLTLLSQRPEGITTRGSPFAESLAARNAGKDLAIWQATLLSQPSAACVRPAPAPTKARRPRHEGGGGVGVGTFAPGGTKRALADMQERAPEEEVDAIDLDTLNSGDWVEVRGDTWPRTDGSERRIGRTVSRTRVADEKIG
jgi:hypothetical protein